MIGNINDLMNVLNEFQAPPPDPKFSFLADHIRDGNGESSRELPQDSSGSRRHPRNFGGQSFDSVKSKMKSEKERQVCLTCYFVHHLAAMSRHQIVPLVNIVEYYRVTSVL